MRMDPQSVKPWQGKTAWPGSARGPVDGGDHTPPTYMKLLGIAGPR